jgi:hypothetical protein
MEFTCGRGLPDEWGDLASESMNLWRPLVIVASAKIAGAALFYKNDAKCRRLATEAGTTALDLPILSENWAID